MVLLLDQNRLFPSPEHLYSYLVIKKKTQIKVNMKKKHSMGRVIKTFQLIKKEKPKVDVEIMKKTFKNI